MLPENVEAAKVKEPKIPPRRADARGVVGDVEKTPKRGGGGGRIRGAVRGASRHHQASHSFHTLRSVRGAVECTSMREEEEFSPGIDGGRKQSADSRTRFIIKSLEALRDRCWKRRSLLRAGPRGG